MNLKLNLANKQSQVQPKNRAVPILKFKPNINDECPEEEK